MSKTRPKEKRRGGVRDESYITIGLNRCQLAALLDEIQRKCDLLRRREQSQCIRH